MSKKTTTEAPAYKTLDELKEKGTVTLTANTRDGLFAQAALLADNVPEGKHIVYGAVARNKEDGSFTLRVDLV